MVRDTPAKSNGLAGAKLGGERSRHCFSCRDLQARNNVEPSLLIIVLRANAHELVALGIVEPGDPGSKWSKLMTQVEVVGARPRCEIGPESQLRLKLIGVLNWVPGLFALTGRIVQMTRYRDSVRAAVWPYWTAPKQRDLKSKLPERKISCGQEEPGAQSALFFREP